MIIKFNQPLYKSYQTFFRKGNIHIQIFFTISRLISQSMLLRTLPLYITLRQPLSVIPHNLSLRHTRQHSPLCSASSPLSCSDLIGASRLTNSPYIYQASPVKPESDTKIENNSPNVIARSIRTSGTDATWLSQPINRKIPYISQTQQN